MFRATGKCSAQSDKAATVTTLRGDTNVSDSSSSSADYRQLIAQEQVRSLRRRLWRAFQDEDAARALRAYKATARDLQAWVQEEIQESKNAQWRREKEKVREKFIYIILMLYFIASRNA